MRKQIQKLLFLWMLMTFSIAAYAQDWPATLYMAQTSYSSTGRGTAEGVDGVYEFEFTPYTSSTTAPRYYIFTSASSATNAKKGTYKVYGAATIADGTNIQPVDGIEYPLVDLSSKEDATALASQPMCAFMPIYYAYLTIKATVDLNKGTVKFDRDPVEEATTTLSIFRKDQTKPLATATPDAEGVARYSVKFADEVTVYFSANADTRANTQYQNIWGSSTQVNPENVTVAVGTTYPLLRTTYRQVYSDGKCSFTFPAGSYDIIADTKNETVQIAEFSGNYLPKPATLYMRSHTFGTSYGTSSNVNGTYEFTFDKSASYTSEPFRLIFSDVSSLSSAQNSLWILGSTTEAKSVTPEFGKAYPLVHVDPNTVSTDPYNGTFMPLYPQAYTVNVDLNAMTVTFTPTVEVDALTKLNILNDAFKLVGTAEPGADGKFRYSYHGNAGAKIFLTTAEVRTDMQSAGRQNFGAGGHANPADLTTEYGKSYEAAPISYRRLYTEKTGYFELPGKCDLVFDPATNSLAIENYTGQYETYPATLKIKSDAISSTTYAEAEGHDGVYVFEYTTQGATGTPRNLVFTDANSYSTLNPASWLLGASSDGSTVDTYPGLVTPLYIVDDNTVRVEKQSLFIPFAPYTYTITVDLKNMTAKWGDPVPAPASLKLVDDGFGVYTQSGGADGVYRFETTTYSSHPLFISEATSTSELKETLWTFTANRTGGEDLDITEGVSAAHRSTYYNYIFHRSGFWLTPEGCNKLTAVLDINANTVDWTISPFVPRTAEVLYMVNRDKEPISRIVSDNSGIFEFDVTLRSSTYVGFSDSDSDVNDPGRTFYGASVPYAGNNVSPISGTEYPLYITSGDAFADSNSVFYLSSGRWKVRVDLNSKKISFEDISRGGVWYVPESIALCDDDLKVIATGVQGEEGVFTFSDVAITSDRDIRKVVLLDTAEGGSIFGANASGEVGPEVESGNSYELYMPTRLWVTGDGASCFGLRPSTYNITADFNNKTITFVDPSVPVYPAKMAMTKVEGESTSTLSTVSGSNGVYTYSLRNDEAVTIYFTDPAEGTLYGSAVAATEIRSGAVVGIAAAAEPVAFTIPEGLWRVEMSLADMTVKFTETPRPKFVSTTMPSGSRFHSYFGAGTDSKAVFTFNNKIKSVQGVYVVLGDYTGGVPDADNPTTDLGLRGASISENNLIVDFTGQHYAIPEGAEPKVHIVLSKVVDANNETLVCDAVPGLPAGSMVFEYPFSEFERIAIQGSFDTPSKSNIDEALTLKMHVSRFDDITFSDVVFEDYKPIGPSIGGSGEELPDHVKYPARWERGATDADGFTELTVYIPMSIRGRGDFRLILDGLDIDDGYDDHADDLYAIYSTVVDPTVTVTSTPADASTVGRVDEIVLTWSHPVISSVGNKASSAVIVNTATGEKTEAAYSYPADEKSLVLTPSAAIEAQGSYRLEIGAGDLVFNDDQDALNNPLALTFAVDPSLGVSGIAIADTDEVTVVDLNGIVVRHGKGRATLSGLSGIYIVNGVKCRLSE